MVDSATMDHVRCSHRKYGLTCDEYDSMAAEANGICPICSQDRPLVIDHDHRLGAWAVRGLVCHRCNSMLAQIDSGRWPGTEAARQMIADPWHARHRAGPPPTRPVRPVTELGKTPLHSFRVDTKLWDAARDLARENEETIADVLRRALEAYVKRGKR